MRYYQFTHKIFMTGYSLRLQLSDGLQYPHAREKVAF